MAAEKETPRPAAAASAPNMQELVRQELARMSPEQLRALAGRGEAEQRRARYAAERAARIAKLVIVRFERAYLNFNVGEVAGLEPREANAAIVEGFASRVGGAAPAREDVRPSDQTRETERAQVELVAKFIGALDKDEAGHFEGGKPSLAKLTQLAGFAVTAEQRDAAWGKHRAAQEARGR